MWIYDGRFVAAMAYDEGYCGSEENVTALLDPVSSATLSPTGQYPEK